METEAMKELREIKKALSAGYRNVREFCEALIQRQNAAHPELASRMPQPAYPPL